MLQKYALGTVAAVAMLSVGTMASAQSGGPAVSDVNGKVAIGGGAFDDNEFGFVEGAFSVPLGQNFGFQGDGLVGLSDDGELYGTAAHLFWRDPSVGLFGAYGGAMHVEDSARDYTHYAVGAEGELYLDRVSIEALVGYSTGKRIDDDILFDGSLAYYLTDDVRIAGGARYLQDDLMGTGGFEFQLSQSGASLFGEGGYHDGDRWQAFAGIRFYFGSSKPLIRRHREDDPGVRLSDSLFTVGGNQQIEEQEEGPQDELEQVFIAN